MTAIAQIKPAECQLESFLNAQTSEATRRAYRSDLIGFFGTSLIIADQIQDTTTEDIEDYRNSLMEQGVKPNTINRKLTSLRGFFKRSQAKGLIAINPCDLVKGYKKSNASVGKAVETDALLKMIEIASKHPNKYKAKRDVALITVLLYAGLRRSEACNMEWSHIQREGGYDILVLPNTKSGVQQHVKLAKRAMDALRELRAVSLSDAPYVFESISPYIRSGDIGDKLHPDSLNRIIKYYGEKAGVSLSAHSLRHTCCTLSMEGGSTVQQAQAHLRHADISTTMRYFEDRNHLSDNASDYILMEDTE
jgi:integrase